MIKNYKVKITPLEPYTLGTEQGSKFEGASSTGKETYIIASAQVPEQTTILGTLRYIALANKKLLKSNFRYSVDEQAEMAEVIGAKSFSFEGAKQDFGLIKSVSPIFLMDKEHIYIANPYCNKAEKGYRPYELEAEPVMTSKGALHLPGDGYDAKAGYGRGYICINDAEKNIISVSELFQTSLISGNRADHKDGSDKEGFFKREIVSLNKKYAFGIYVEAEEDLFPESIIAYMGRKQSAFRFEFLETTDKSLEEQVMDAFKDETDVWYYALSDIYAPEMELKDAFAIAGQKKIRNLETILSAEKYVAKRKKIDRQIHLIPAGSVFRNQPGLPKENEKYTTIGYNKIIRLGGTN